jgi:hypothetical protein
MKSMAGEAPPVVADRRDGVQNDAQNENLGGGFYKDGV